MNIAQYNLEWKYRYEERLGILCEDREPTEEEQKAIAKAEADDWGCEQRVDK